MKRFKGVVLGVLSLMLVLFEAIPVSAADNAISAQLKGSDVVYQAGQSVDLTLVISNTGTNVLNNIAIQPVYSNSVTKWPFKEVDQVAHRKTISEIKQGEATEVTYSLTTREDVKSERCRISFNISGVGDGSLEFTVFPFTQAVEQENGGQDKEANVSDSGGVQSGTVSYDEGGVYNGSSTSGGESGNGSVPRVIVTGFTTEPGNVKAGTDFKLVLHLKNTSKKTAVSNMVLDFSAPTEGTDEMSSAPAFLPTSGSNSIYIEKIGANGAYDVAINLNAKADLVQKPYELNVSMKYEDKEANQFESESSISVPIKQEARFEFSEFEISPESLSVGGEANVMCNMYNLGKIKLYNVKATFEGEGISAKEVFIGNIEPGATASIDGMVTAEKEITDAQKLKMVVTYEDSSGVISKVEEEFKLIITSAELDEMDMEGMEEIEEQGGGLPIGMIALALVAVLAAIIIAVVVIRKKKKMQQEGDGLEDELDRLIEDE